MNVILRNGAHQAFNHRDPNYTEKIKVGMCQDSGMQVELFLTKCEQSIAEDLKVDLRRSNSVLPFSFLLKEKLSQAGKAELSSLAVAFRTSYIQHIPVWDHIIS